MSVASLRWKRSPEHVRETPDTQGVLTLWDGEESVYIDYTPGNSSLRDRLRELHALQQEGLIEFTHFSWETTATAKTRAGDLLALAEEKQGKPPRYNRPESPLQPPRGCVTDLRARA